MIRFLVFFMVLIFVVSAAGAAIDETWIYKGQPAAQEGVTFGSWGSGKIVESKKKAIEGSNSIEITSQSFYAGGLIDWTKPIPLSVGTENKDHYLVFVVFFADTKSVNPAGANYETYDVEPYNVPLVSKVRFVFVTDDGKKTSFIQITTPIDPDDGWVRISVPLEKLNFGEGIKSVNIKQILLFTDIESTFNVGQIKTVKDDTLIKLGGLGSQFVAIGDQVFMQAEVQFGVSSLYYNWDFGDSTILEENTTEKIAGHVYKVGGDFTVTLSVTDAAGVKSPAKATTVISVSD